MPITVINDPYSNQWANAGAAMGRGFGQGFNDGVQQLIQIKRQKKMQEEQQRLMADIRAQEMAFQQEMIELAHQQRLEEMAYQQQLQEAVYKKAVEQKQFVEQQVYAYQRAKTIYCSIAGTCVLIILTVAIVAKFKKMKTSEWHKLS